MIDLIYGGSFDENLLIKHIKQSGLTYIIQGQQSVTYNNHSKKRSLDYWLRPFAKNADTKQADNRIIEALVNTGKFEIRKLKCPDTGIKCKGIKLLELENDNVNYKEARNAYSYPAAYLACHLARCDLNTYKSVRALEETSSKEKSLFTSTLKLDSYHSELLNSSNVDEVILGLSSVIYWGNYFNKKTPNHGLAWNRVKRFHLGNKKSHKSLKTVGKENIYKHVLNAKTLILQKMYGEALAEITKIPWLSISFGSKVLAFLEPNCFGVYDIHISRYIERPDLEMKSTGVITTSTIKTFTAYCNFLIEKAEELNNSSTPTWTDWNNKEHIWRAVDVERAMFHLATSNA